LHCFGFVSSLQHILTMYKWVSFLLVHCIIVTLPLNHIHSSMHSSQSISCNLSLHFHKHLASVQRFAWRSYTHAGSTHTAARVTGYGTVETYDDPKNDVFLGPPFQRNDIFASQKSFKETFLGLSGEWQDGLQFLRLPRYCLVTDSTSFVAILFTCLMLEQGGMVCAGRRKKKEGRKTAENPCLIYSGTIS
jgi:hypothetical protein